MGLAAGLASAGVVSVVSMLRTYGVARVNMVTVETLSGLGVLPGAGAPDLDLLPTKESAAQALSDHEADGGVVRTRRLILAPYLLLGVLSLLLVKVWLG